MRVILNEWDSLRPKHLADALRRLSRVAPWDRDAKSSGGFGDADFAPIVRRVEEIASARLDEAPGRTPSRAGHREQPDIFAEEAFAVVAANALVNLGKRRAAFDPTRVGSPGWRAWRAVLALPAAPGRAPYKPRNVMRLWYAMATAHDAAGNDAGREAAVPDAAWTSLDAMTKKNAKAGRHFNAQGVGIGVWSHAKTGKPIAPSTLRAFEVAVARGAFDHVATVGQNVSNSLWGLAKLGHAVSRGILEHGAAGFPSPRSKFEDAVRRLAPGMRPQEIANTMYAYALMGTPPSATTWKTLEAEARARAGGHARLDAHVPFESKGSFVRRRTERGLFGPQEMTNVWWAHATLGMRPSQSALYAYDETTAQTAFHMSAQDVSNTAYSMAMLNVFLRPGAFDALEGAIARNGRHTAGQNLSLTLWAFADLAVRPGPDAAAALADAVENRLHTLNPQNVNMCVWAFAILGMTPPPGAWRAMTTGMEEVIETLKPHEVMNAVWAMAAAHVTGEKLPLTPAYAMAWRRLCSIPLDGFARSESRAMTRSPGGFAKSDRAKIGIIHHARLIHERLFPPESAASVDIGAIMPSEMALATARDFRADVMDTTRSKMQDKIAETLSDIGIEFETEKRSADGNFSMDFYLPRYDVALEYDGPSHYYRAWRDEDRAFPRTVPGVPARRGCVRDESPAVDRRQGKDDQDDSPRRATRARSGEQGGDGSRARGVLVREQTRQTADVHRELAQAGVGQADDAGNAGVVVRRDGRKRGGRRRGGGGGVGRHVGRHVGGGRGRVRRGDVLFDVGRGGRTDGRGEPRGVGAAVDPFAAVETAREAGASTGAGGERGGDVDAGGGVRGGGRHEGEGGVATGGFGGARVTYRVIELLFELELLLIVEAPKRVA